MTILKWYSVILMTILLLRTLYEYREKEDDSGFGLTLILLTPIVIYLILS